MLLHWTSCAFWTESECDYREPRAEVSLSCLYIFSILSVVSVFGAWFLIFMEIIFIREVVEEILGSFFLKPF